MDTRDWAGIREILNNGHKRRGEIIARRIGDLELTQVEVGRHFNKHAHTISGWCREGLARKRFLEVMKELGADENGTALNGVPDWVQGVYKERAREHEERQKAHEQVSAENREIIGLVKKIYYSRAKHLPENINSVKPEDLEGHAQANGFDSAEEMLREARSLKPLQTRELGSRVKTFAVACRVLCEYWKIPNLRELLEAMPDKEALPAMDSLYALTSEGHPYGGPMDSGSRAAPPKTAFRYPSEKKILNLLAGIYYLDAEQPRGQGQLSYSRAVRHLAEAVKDDEPLVLNQQLKVKLQRAMDDVIAAAEDVDENFRNRGTSRCH